MEEPGVVPELFYLGGNTDPDDSKPAEEAIFNHFVEQGNIVPLHFNDEKKHTCKTYTTKRARDRFHSSQENNNMYPKNISIK